MHYDNLGSIDTITDHLGEVTQRFIYKPFGEKIALTGQGELESSNAGGSFRVKRGFTGHEHIDEFDFIHMNGRVYDPIVGRFISADPNIPYVFESQSYNRYSYTRNNPLKYVDPSGYEDLGSVDVYADDEPDLSDLYGGGDGDDDYLQDENGDYLTKATNYNETFYNGMNHINVTVVPIEIHIEPIDMNSILEKVKLRLAKRRNNVNEQEEKAQRERHYLYERYGVYVEGATVELAGLTPLGRGVKTYKIIKPYTKRRPSFRKGVVDKVWEKAKRRDGKVYDPYTGEELSWDKAKKRFGQWDMGHKKGHSYKDYMNGKISKEEFLDKYNDPNNYHPQSLYSNRSRKND